MREKGRRRTIGVKRYFLDTSFLIDLIRGDEKAVQKHDEIKGHEVTGTICLYELSKFYKEDINEKFRDKDIIEMGIKDSVEAGKVYQELKEKGDPVGEMDTLISGQVRNRDLVLVTRDKHFEKVEEIEVEFYR